MSHETANSYVSNFVTQLFLCIYPVYTINKGVTLIPNTNTMKNIMEYLVFRYITNRCRIYYVGRNIETMSALPQLMLAYKDKLN